MRRLVFLFGLLIFLPGLFACGLKKPPAVVPQKADLAVAGFMQPRHGWQLLAGYIHKNQREIPEKELAQLDTSLANALKDSGRKHYMKPDLVRQCREIILHESNRSRVSAMAYWVKVGRCIPADYLLVPYVFEMDKRKGDDWGVREPASVVLDLYLIDVQKKRMNRYHFEETQRSFSENMLEIRKFVRREGKWLTANQLAADGIKQGVMELGL